VDHVVSRRGGLLVAEESMAFEQLERALKQLDRDLVLNVEFDPVHGCAVYDVHKVISRDRPAAFICRWMDAYGTPLPLSSGLLELVQKLQSGHGEDADELNRRMLEADERDVAEGVREIVRDMLPRITGKRIPVLHRGIHLRRARARNGRYDR